MDFYDDITIPTMRGLLIIVAIGIIFSGFLVGYRMIEILGLEILLFFCSLVIIVLIFGWFLGFSFGFLFEKEEIEE